MKKLLGNMLTFEIAFLTKVISTKLCLEAARSELIMQSRMIFLF